MLLSFSGLSISYAAVSKTGFLENPGLVLVQDFFQDK